MRQRWGRWGPWQGAVSGHRSVGAGQTRWQRPCLARRYRHRFRQQSRPIRSCNSCKASALILVQEIVCL